MRDPASGWIQLNVVELYLLWTAMDLGPTPEVLDVFLREGASGDLLFTHHPIDLRSALSHEYLLALISASCARARCEERYSIDATGPSA